MKRIKEDIKNNSFSRFYLLYGSESFLKNLYRDKLTKAMLPEGDDINLTRFEGKSIDISEVISIANTLPFFADKRLVIVKDSGWFKSACEISEVIQSFPDSTYFIFTEADVDKRNKLFKFVSSNGYATEIKTPETKELMTTVAATLKQRGLMISQSDCEYLVTKVGSDMARVQSELDKLSALCMDSDVVTRKDIDCICSEMPEGKVFLMIDAIMGRNEDRALELYYQLLAAHEKAMSVLFLLISSYNQFYQTLVLDAKGYSKQKIAASAGIRDFLVDKYLRMGRRYDSNRLKEIVEFGIDLEEKIKQGNMDERIAVEIFVVKASAM